MNKNTQNVVALHKAPAQHPNDEAPPSFRFLSIRDVTRQVGLSKTTIYAMMKQGKFPEPFNLMGTSVRWVSTQIEQWMWKQLPEKAKQALNDGNFGGNFEI